MTTQQRSIKRKLAIATVAIAVLIGASVTWLTLHRRSGSARLGDGTVLRVQHLALGKHLEYRDDNPKLRELARNLKLPAAVQKLIPAGKVYTTDVDRETLAVWLSCYDPKSDQHVAFELNSVKVIDDAGFKYDAYGALKSRPMGRKNIPIASVFIHNFPRRQSRFWLEAKVGMETVRLRIPNPKPVQAPIWQGQPLPATATNGMTSVVLSSVAWQKEPAHWMLKPDFRVMMDGKDRSEWFDHKVEFEDATGNQAPSLSWGEPALKMNISLFWRATAPRQPSEIWQVTGVRTPSEGQYEKIGFTRSWLGAEIKAISLTSPGRWIVGPDSVSPAVAAADGKLPPLKVHDIKALPGAALRIDYESERALLLVKIAGLSPTQRFRVRVGGAEAENMNVFVGSGAALYQLFSLPASANSKTFDIDLVVQTPQRFMFQVFAPKPNNRVGE